MLIKITSDASFSQDTLSVSLPSIVDFWAPWCGPCKMLLPILEEIAKTFDKSVQIFKMNIDENPHTPSKYSVRTIPTLIFLKEGVLVDTKIGLHSCATLENWVRGNL